MKERERVKVNKEENKVYVLPDGCPKPRRAQSTHPACNRPRDQPCQALNRQKQRAAQAHDGTHSFQPPSAAWAMWATAVAVVV